MRVAVLGGSGFAGRHVCAVLEGAGITVHNLSRSTGCDLLDEEAAAALIEGLDPDYIVNCAAVVGSINYVTEYAADVVDLNMRIILSAYRIALRCSHAVMVNPIANCAYPGVMDVYRETGLWDGPIHPSVLSYGSTRRMMLVLSECYGQQYGLRSINLVVPNMYGPGDSTDPNKTHALNALVIKGVRAVLENTSRIEVWGTGKPVREWLYVGDFARLILAVIQSGETSADPVNLAQNRGYSVNELVETIRAAVGYGGEVAHNTEFQDGAPRKVMDDTLFNKRFPEFEFTPIEEGIASTVEYYRGVL